MWLLRSTGSPHLGIVCACDPLVHLDDSDALGDYRVTMKR
jgi:hypothetical protein